MSRQPFNADARADERESVPTTIGERDFFAVRLSNDAMRAVRAIARRASPAGRAVAVAEREVNAARQELAKLGGAPEPDQAAILAKQEEIETLEEKLDELEETQQVAQGTALFEQLKLLLRDGDGDHPEVKFLEQHLDTRDAGPMMAWLMGGDEEDEGKDEAKEEETTSTSS